MTIPAMTQAKTYLRVIESDLDVAIILAISAAQAELDAFIGGDSSAQRWPTEEEVPGDVLGAVLLLMKVHFEETAPDKAEQWRGRAQGLLTPYRVSSGVKGA